ncbi:MAG TPA: NYN domain-containing protein [Methylomirabilota bacterium]|nr:NYN domain-containing protein [Methylomirabilota bacterium]
MRWLVDGYNVIRRSSELAARERESLERGRRALIGLLSASARDQRDQFTVVFDGAGPGGSGLGAARVRVLFSSARGSADALLAQLARPGDAVVSSDRAVQAAARRAGAVAVSADDFLARLSARPAGAPTAEADKDEEQEPARGPKKGNPRRLGKRERARQRALGRLGRPPGP